MQLITLTESHRKSWDKFVIDSPNSTKYHLSGWKNILEKTYGIKPFYLMVVRDDEILGILPLFLVKGFPFTSHLISLPYLSYTGICSNEPEVERELMLEAGRLMERLNARYVELHNIYKLNFSTDELNSSTDLKSLYTLATVEDKVTMILPLESDPELMWKSFKAKVRNQVRKAVKSGLKVTIGGVEFLDEFYSVFTRNMRDLGSPVHSKSFFENIFEVFPDDSRIFIVHTDSEPVGGAILISFRDTAEVPWASSKREYFQYCPNNLLYWEIIKYCCERGFKTFDFGRSTKGSGTYRFKKQWGAQEKQLYWQYYLPEGSKLPDVTHTGLKSRIMVGLWKRMPLRLANLLGPKIRGRISA